MKQNFLTYGTLMLILCSAAACSSDNEPMETKPEKNITFSVVTKEKEEMTRAAIADAFSNLYYYRYTDGELITNVTQAKGDEGFGEITDKMKYGDHDIYVVGSKNEMTGWADGIASFDKISDTFSCHINMSVSKNTSTLKTLEVLRRVAKFELVATDALPENLSTMEITIEGGATELNVKTGKGNAISTQTKTISVPASNIGKQGCTFSAYAFLVDDESTTSVTITAKDNNGNEIVSYTFDDVEMQTNYITRLTGTLFSDDFTSNITVSTEWEGEIEYEF